MRPLTIVLGHTPETEEFEEEWEVLSIHGGRPAEPGIRSLSEAEWAHEYIGCVGLEQAIWGERAAPAEYAKIKKVLMTGKMTIVCVGGGDWGREYEDALEVESERVLA